MMAAVHVFTLGMLVGHVVTSYGVWLWRRR
jgi:hypothetical protein